MIKIILLMLIDYVVCDVNDENDFVVDDSALVMARYPCLTYQSTLPSYLPPLLDPRSYSLITFFAQTVTLPLLSALTVTCRNLPLGPMIPG